MNVVMSLISDALDNDEILEVAMQAKAKGAISDVRVAVSGVEAISLDMNDASSPESAAYLKMVRALFAMYEIKTIEVQA